MAFTEKEREIYQKLSEICNLGNRPDDKAINLLIQIDYGEPEKILQILQALSGLEYERTRYVLKCVNVVLEKIKQNTSFKFDLD